ncbi:purine permease [Alteromonas aestuariivivens]|uniref:Purine permease n=1 Tax=Alteromonas aestuariivivens TaxID=1938339 RepID=A0A3D8M6W2_9ALTE|nr:nucleobase:cation symporter-2 family protein [Alteromonas aestuariivivens]RDV25522.1 purine permease [Alteromonas aestuariivivens]
MADTRNTDMLYALDDRPPVVQSVTAAAQHVLACFIGVINGTLIIGGALGLTAELPYLISMALFVSGLATFIQAKKFGPVGSGLIAVQGTSFAFVSALLVAGVAVKHRGGSNEDVLAMMFGICFWGALVEIALSQFIDKLKRIITPLTTGIVVTTIGLSLIKYGMTDLAGGFGAENFAASENLLIGGFVLLVVLVLNSNPNPWVRLSAILVGMLTGSLIAWSLGMMNFDHLASLPAVAVPEPFKYGYNFDWQLFIPVAMVYLLTAIETAGDLTANCLFCRIPLQSKDYFTRVKGGILADGINSMIAAVFNTFPNTTFGQNNAVIQMTGVASRYVGFYVAGILMLLGLFPLIGGIFQAMPKPVLGGATLVMFATIAVAGIRILTSEPIDRRKSLIIATSLGCGLGVMMVPNALSQLPQWAQDMWSSPVTVSGFCAIFLSVVMPQPQSKEEVVHAA